MDAGGDTTLDVLDDFWRPILASEQFYQPKDDLALTMRATTIRVAIIGMMWYTVCSATDGPAATPGPLRWYAAVVYSMKSILLTYFFLASVALLFAATVVSNEWVVVVKVYIWYTLAFVMMGLLVHLAEFLLQVKCKGIMFSTFVMVPDVAFLFVLFRCLPFVDKYARELLMLA